MDTTLQPAAEWEKELGISILDADGWVERRINWYEPITEELFLRLANASTANFTEYDRRRKENGN